MNSSYSLHKIADESHYPFDANEYSWFKFGDKQYAEQFASDLFVGFVEKYGDLLLSNKEIVILPSPYLSIPTASNFLRYYFKKRLNSFLYKNNIKASIESKIYRNQTYVTDYGNLDFDERVFHCRKCKVESNLLIPEPLHYRNHTQGSYRLSTFPDRYF